MSDTKDLSPAEALALAQGSVDKMDGTVLDMENLKEHSAKMGEGLSRMPEVRKFLEARGLTSYDQLDERGREELRRHCEAVYASLTGKTW